VLLGVAMAMPAFFAVRNLSTWPARLRYRGELDSVEGRELAEMTMLREGYPIYSRPSAESFHSTNYGPLYYLLGSRLVDPQKPAYARVRLLAMLTTLMLAAACGLLAWWLTRSPVAAALSSLIFLAYRFVTVFATAARADGFALLLWFGGFLVAYRFRYSRKILWSIPLMALGAYFKQQLIVAPLAVLLFLLLEKRYKLALQFATLLAGAGLGLLAAFQFVVFRGQAFSLHFLTYNLVPFSGWGGLLWLRFLAIVFLIPGLLALASLRSQPDKLLACYFGWAVVLLPFMIAKKGTQMNYCFELLLVLCPLLAALVINCLGTPLQGILWIYLLGVGLFLGQIVKGGINDPTPEDFAADQKVQAFLHSNFPAHTPGLGEFTGDLVRAGLETPVTDLYQFSWLACEGKVQDAGLIAQLRRRYFAVFLITTDLRSESETHGPYGMCLSEPFHQAVLENYRLVESFDFHLWEQKHYYAWVVRSSGPQLATGRQPAGKVQ
jgi:hypothetical protein